MDSNLIIGIAIGYFLAHLQQKQMAQPTPTPVGPPPGTTPRNGTVQPAQPGVGYLPYGGRCCSIDKKNLVV